MFKYFPQYHNSPEKISSFAPKMQNWPNFVLPGLVIFLAILLLLLFVYWQRHSNVQRNVTIVTDNALPDPPLLPPTWNTSYDIATAQDAARMINAIYTDSLPTVSNAIHWQSIVCNQSMYGYWGEYQGTIYVIFRGTDVQNLDEIRADLKISQTPFADKLCHFGFVEQFNCLKPSLPPPQFFTGKQVFITGHSLGAALGYLLALELAAVTTEIVLYTFGSPRVCNECDHVPTAFTFFNVQNEVDPIVTLPPAVVNLRKDKPPALYCATGTRVTFQENKGNSSMNHALSTYFQGLPILK